MRSNAASESCKPARFSRRPNSEVGSLDGVAAATYLNVELFNRKGTAVIRHMFMWRLKNLNEAEEVLSVLNELPGQVPVIKGWAVGAHHGAPGDSGEPWHGGLVADFDSFDDLHAYETHPFHVDVVERLLPKFADRAVADFPFEPSMLGGAK
jgi:hypothetical protein